MRRWWQLRHRLARVAWPDYSCEDCIGMTGLGHGCYCAHHGCEAPGVPCGRLRGGLRSVLIWTRIAPRMYWGE